MSQSKDLFVSNFYDSEGLELLDSLELDKDMRYKYLNKINKEKKKAWLTKMLDKAKKRFKNFKKLDVPLAR